jgi:hypothetical protein
VGNYNTSLTLSALPFTPSLRTLTRYLRRRWELLLHRIPYFVRSTS